MPTPEFTVRRLDPSDTRDFLSLRREALIRAPLSFGASVEDDVGLDPGFVRDSFGEERESATFGAFDPELVGIVGVHRRRVGKRSHRALLWGLYVTSGHRGRGIGGALVEAAVAHAREMEDVRWLDLSVTGPSEPAAALYASLGFERWGSQPDALRHGGEGVIEHHMVLDLHPEEA